MRVVQEIDDLVTRWDYASATIRYQGHASPGTATSAPQWRIKRFTFDAQARVIAVEFAGGSGERNQIWDNRASLGYS